LISQISVLANGINQIRQGFLPILESFSNTVFDQTLRRWIAGLDAGTYSSHELVAGWLIDTAAARG
jgi:hypothetical protein